MPENKPENKPLPTNKSRLKECLKEEFKMIYSQYQNYTEE